MRRIGLLLLLASCTDVVHYISFDDQGSSLQVLRMSVQRSVVENDPEIAGALNAMGAFRMRGEGYAIQSQDFSNESELGFELRYTANPLFFGNRPSGIVPARERGGFSLTLEPLGAGGRGGEEARAKLEGLKYRILLSKSALRPVQKVEVSTYTEPGNRVSVSEFDSFYLIEFPLAVWLLSDRETKIRFYLR